MGLKLAAREGARAPEDTRGPPTARGLCRWVAGAARGWSCLASHHPGPCEGPGFSTLVLAMDANQPGTLMSVRKLYVQSRGCAIRPLTGWASAGTHLAQQKPALAHLGLARQLILHSRPRACFALDN